MQDRLGRQIKNGDLVSVSNHPELIIKVNWIIIGFVSHELVIECILQNFISGDVVYVNILDLEKEFY
jgi:hypothetical protein